MVNPNSHSERTVECPVCGEEKLARGIHLHVNRSSGNGHGEQGEIPECVNLDDLDTVGEQEVSMDYPETRDTEQVGRRCPFCEQVFRGKQGVMIHLGQMAGQGPHPADAKEEIDPADLPIVQLDDHGNVVEVVEKGTVMPSTRRRREREEAVAFKERVRGVIEEFRQEGKHEAADRLEAVFEEDE